VTVVTDTTKAWTPGKWAGVVLNASQTAGDHLDFLIVTNTAKTLSLRGDLTATGYFSVGLGYLIDDYRLAAGSHNIDASLSAGISPDFASKPRPSGAAWDIGAYEY
jgi:hypothetical protein